MCAALGELKLQGVRTPFCKGCDQAQWCRVSEGATATLDKAKKEDDSAVGAAAFYLGVQLEEFSAPAVTLARSGTVTGTCYANRKVTVKTV